MEITQGVVRHLRRLDYRIDTLLEHPDRPLPLPVRVLLRIGVYQISHLCRIPHHAAVNETVKIINASRYRGFGPLVNALLRRTIDSPEPPLPDPDIHPVEHLEILTSSPKWLVENLLSRMGAAATGDVLLSLNKPGPLTLRVNPLKTDREALIKELDELGVAANPGILSDRSVILKTGAAPEALAPFREGRCTVQDEGAQLIAPLLGAAPGDIVLDLCAAPGGKSGHIAEEMDDMGVILAVDISVKRLVMLRQTLSRLGLSSILPLAADARFLPLRPSSTFSRILIDAPCSGTGVLRRHPEGKWRKDPGSILRLTGLQRDLVVKAGDMLDPGGHMLYTTCSLLEEENEEVIHPFLEAGPFELVDMRKQAEHLPKNAFTPLGELRLWPHLHSCDGFYAALMKKTH